jgi:ribosomal protein L11 methyltransferase
MSSDASYVQLESGDMARMEAMQALLLPFEPLGFVDEDNIWKCFFAPAAWETARDSGILDRLMALSPEFPILITEMKQENWNREWEESITPIRVSDRFIIAPSWHPVDAADGCEVLVIDPKMSFGTGYHQTTRLMMRLLEHSITGGERVLDVGTGTGVLAIAAVRLGAADAVGVDIDEWSKENAEENIARNGVEGRVDVYHGSVERADGSYDVICSNITRNDNIALFGDYRQRARPGCRLLLSGFYTTDLDDIRSAAEAMNFAHIESLSEDEWAAMALTYKGA